ncbi:HAD family hydrolase [Intrasporangium sp.]|uniref:HAD family hydrolase n=1 Tax=Intrasporangium sp. TaxID=1925024 RepID=UPI00322144FD
MQRTDRPGAPDRPRLVASDLDGTLLHSDGTVSARTRAAWAAAGEAGLETVLVTARPPRWLHGLGQVVGPRGIAICGNGAFVYEVATRRMLETHCFATGVVEALVARLRAALPSVVFAAERAGGAYLAAGFPDHRDDARARGVAHGPLAALAGEPVGKLLALAPGVPHDEFLATVEAVVGGRGHLHFSGASGLAEVNAPGVTKAVALERWAGRLGIGARDVWAFGDMPNDLPMLGWAGVGWAVANAHPDVLAAADRICPSNDADGVAVTVSAALGRPV